jgi:enamine deaminase RidA (YjgF/YER057c/UK114 family)
MEGPSRCDEDGYDHHHRCPNPCESEFHKASDRSAINQQGEDHKQMSLEYINPADLPVPETYTQVVVATGSKLVFISGQEPEDINGSLVGRGDLAAQARQVYANLGRALAAAGAGPKQVARITIYVVNYERDQCLPIIEEARKTLFGDHKPADVVLGVASLSPGYLIEVDAIAVLD